MTNSIEKRNFHANIEQLIGLDDHVWSDYLLSNDLLYRKIESQTRMQLINGALQCAEEQYLLLKRKLSYVDPMAYSVAESIQMIDDDSPIVEHYLYLAFYKAQPPSIEISSRAIQNIKKVIKDERLESLLGDVDLYQLIVAHELFHHIEAKKPQIYTNKDKVVLRRYGKFRFPAKIAATSEIAAVHFSKRLLGLNYCPAIFEILLVHSINQQRAQNNIGEIIKRGGG